MEQEEEDLVAIKTPKLDATEKLYVKAYLHKLSHSYAHSVVSPDIKKPKEDNHFSRRENIKFHIAKALQEKTEALEVNADKILEKLYLEATREDRTSSHSARIQALNILGKHLGLFKEKEEKEQFVFNIVNYSSEPSTVSIEKVESSDSNELEIEESNISFTDYSEE